LGRGGGGFLNLKRQKKKYSGGNTAGRLLIWIKGPSSFSHHAIKMGGVTRMAREIPLTKGPNRDDEPHRV